MSNNVRAVGRLGVLAVTALLWTSACSDSQQAYCDVLTEPVPGIEYIKWDNGLTGAKATWGGLLEAGVTRADEETRQVAARAVRADDAGYQKVRSRAPEDVRPALDRLHRLLLDPAEGRAHRNDPEVLEDAAALRNAAHPERCGWAF
jgi:hypothetical protein